MDAVKKSLLAYGYARKYCKEQDIDCLPDDIVGLFVIWLSFCDRFDLNFIPSIMDLTSIDNKHQHLTIKPGNAGEFASAFGQAIISKVTIFEWKFELNGPPLETQIGIIDNGMIDNDETIGDFADATWHGWGLYLRSMYAYHDEDELNMGWHDKIFDYGKQFKFKTGDIIIMTLDLTQEKNENGVLSFDIDAELIEQNETEDEVVYSQILYDDLDINKQYRMAVSMQRDTDEISLLLS